MAGVEHLPEGTDPIELLETIFPGFSAQRDVFSAQLLGEAQSSPNLPDIQSAMIRALHLDGEDVDGDGFESDEKLLERMRADSGGFAESVRRALNIDVGEKGDIT